ncbi:hypothetical protein TrVE_jg2045 [Triparma verrucosa]|uniref:BspA family leucine-rich repeat surface protein n=1 Tax=Triparma verrucosa TaxID=1606542 RepID=A0A9W7EUZ8_9STRA|nr:hypothetical protein TrVE_jg2045 [Triparma verrucosa]
MSKRTSEALNNSIEIPDPNSLEGGGDQEEVYEGSESNSAADGDSIDISSMTVAALKAELSANFIKYKSNKKKAALATLLHETLEARSKIHRLNEDVQGYIVSFLSGFDSLHMATQLAKGFRLRAKPRLDSILKRSDADIKVAAKAWCEDAEAAREIYGPISIWNTSEVTSMRGLFSAHDEDVGEAAKQFNEDISRWDVSNVTTMEWIFWGASMFNGDLSLWNVSNVTTMSMMFCDVSSFNGDLSSWDVSNVTAMESMFNRAKAFNGDLSSWDVFNVTTMQSMFFRASAFNGNLSSWNVENVSIITRMFKDATSFDLEASTNKWDLSSVMGGNDDFLN